MGNVDGKCLEEADIGRRSSLDEWRMNNDESSSENGCLRRLSSYGGEPAMPWFGMDIGGTLAKLVYFEPTDGKTGNDNFIKTKAVIHRYLTTNKAYGTSGHRDIHLQLDNVEIRGRLGTIHFIRFPSSQMNAFIKIAKDKGMADCASTVCATGGGAHKFEADFRREVNMKLNKYDEIESLIRGLQFIIGSLSQQQQLHTVQQPNNSSANVQNHEAQTNGVSCDESLAPKPELFYFENPSSEEMCRKVFVDSSDDQSEGGVYPYLLVNIGSGVSILSVTGENDFKRVYGTSLGGGTFLGLCCLLTGCDTFEEALDLAAKGDHQKVDKLVRDIYGTSSCNVYGLSGETVASSFGQMNLSEKRAGASPEDLARATLVTITNNIASITRLCARTESINRVIFVGNFLRINEIAMRLLATAMNFWSEGAIKAVFCRHEGYLGAIGSLVMKTTESIPAS